MLRQGCEVPEMATRTTSHKSKERKQRHIALKYRVESYQAYDSEGGHSQATLA